MSKEKQIQDHQTKQLIDELSKMPPMVIATAYLHAINYTNYGVDVTEKWVTATQQVCALEKARNSGYYDGLQRCAESEKRAYNKGFVDGQKALEEHLKLCKEDKGWIPVSERLPEKYSYTLWCASSGFVRSDYFNGEFWEDAKKYCYEVIAWMPLPEPYRAESEAKE